MAVIVTVGARGHTKDGKPFSGVAGGGAETPELLNLYFAVASMIGDFEKSGAFGDIMPFYDKKTV